MAKKPSYKPVDHLPEQPGTDEQSGSTGRPTDTHESGRATDSGQGRYGQTGAGGGGRETMGQERYRKSNPDGAEQPDPGSNPGSGRPDVDPNDDQNAKDGERKP